MSVELTRALRYQQGLLVVVAAPGPVLVMQSEQRQSWGVIMLVAAASFAWLVALRLLAQAINTVPTLAPRAEEVDPGPLRVHRVKAVWPDESVQVWHFLNEADSDITSERCMSQGAELVTQSIGSVTFCSHAEEDGAS